MNIINTIIDSDQKPNDRIAKNEQSLSNQLRAMIDMSSIVSKTDPKGIITYVNDTFCELTGYSREELVGQPHNIVRNPEINPLFFEQMWKTIQNKKMFRDIIKNRRKDGSSYYVDSTISAIVDDNDQIIEYISIRHDVTALIEKQHELDRALLEVKVSSQAESRFLATMSHEMRTPLNGILGFAELLAETPLNEQQKKYLKTIEYSTETLYQIINDILDVMKFDREVLELNLESINITGELESIIYPFYSIAHKKEVDLLVFIDPKLPASVDADLLRLKQILNNLVSNAIKFTPSGKKVYVRIKKLKTVEDKITIQLTVADKGIGVRPEHKADIFKPFVQADNSIAREFGGTGLGLNIVSHVIHAMNGKISLKSIFGVGSVFRVLMECTHSDQKPNPIQASKVTAFEHLRILIAEDNEVNQFYIQELLNRLNIEHDLAHDGYQVIKKFMEKKYDLVLMDINMPNMDGITATSLMLQYEKENQAKHTPIIGLSADAVAKDISLYLSQGLDGYLIKPLRKSELTELLNTYFTPHTITKTIPTENTESLMPDNENLIPFVASKTELPGEIVINLFNKFISNAQAILTKFQEEHEDTVALKMAIHSLKGISRNLYLEELGNSCEALEHDLPTLTPDEKSDRLKELREETLKTVKQMKSELP